MQHTKTLGCLIKSETPFLYVQHEKNKNRYLCVLSCPKRFQISPKFMTLIVNSTVLCDSAFLPVFSSTLKTDAVMMKACLGLDL